MEEIARSEREASETKRQAAASIEKVKQEARHRITQEQEECRKSLDDLNEELERAHEEGVYLAGLNENLLRIARERANADRKLKPKKEHTGYVVVSSTEKEYRYKINRRDFETATL